MSQKKGGADHDAVKAWAETLKSGLGLVRFGDLPPSAFEQLLKGAANQESKSYQLLVAQHATEEGLGHLESLFGNDVDIMSAVIQRRSELRRLAQPAHDNRFAHVANVVSFPGAFEPSAAATTATTPLVEAPAEDLNQPAAATVAVKPRKASLRDRLKHIASSILTTFNEDPTEFDEPEAEAQTAPAGVAATEPHRT